MRTMFDALGSIGSTNPHEPHENDDESLRKRYRTIFISDLHLGTPGCQAAALLDFLKAHPSDNLYLVGDIIDGWQLRRKWYWPQAHNDVVQKLLKRARKGCRVVYVPGNHDEFARGFIGHRFGISKSSRRLFTQQPMASSCGSFMVIILMLWCSVPSGWLLWVTTCMSSRSNLTAI